MLQKIPGMHVAARTSAFSFKGKNATAQEIGQKLGVAYLVDGSVRKSGEAVRIAARLTRADTGEEVWSENFTRDLKDVFAVQTELAETIVAQVRDRLTGSAADSADKQKIQAEVQAAEKGGTKNVEAHQLYLQGRFYENRNSEKSTGEALAAYQRAAELDPKFALAWAGVARANIWYCNFATEGGLESFDAHLSAGREATARALAIEPDLPDGLFARSMIQVNFDFDWKGAGETLRKALGPGSPGPGASRGSGKSGDSSRRNGAGARFLSPGGRGRPSQRASPLLFSWLPGGGEAIRGSTRRIRAGDRIEPGGTGLPRRSRLRLSARRQIGRSRQCGASRYCRVGAAHHYGLYPLEPKTHS